MLRLKFFLFIQIIGLVFYLDANGQTDSIPVRLAGRVESVDSAFQLPYIHVINKRTGRGTISDSVGVFKIKLLQTDTLLIRCIGFTDYLYTLPDTLSSKICFITLKMLPTSYSLKEIDVYALTRQQQFKYDFIHVKLDDKLGDNELYIPGVSNPNYRKLRNKERPVYPTFVGGPFGFAYRMSAKGQSYERLAELVSEDKMKIEADKKYNMDLLSLFTGYTGNKLLAFYIYLSFTTTYVYNTDEYELYVRISQNMNPFEQHFKDHGLPINFLEGDKTK